jgi:glycine dehydrogenase subunit 1
MAYIFDTPDSRKKMLDAVGVSSLDELFEQIPAELHLNRELNLPALCSELELQQDMERRLSTPRKAEGICFLGGGIYDHFIPAVVDEITSRGEFYTAYTPYQAEASQGTLQAFFEYQTLICRLTGMEVSNASLYEGATAISEAIFMAMRVTGRTGEVVVAGTIHPEYRQVLETCLLPLNVRIVTVPGKDGLLCLSRLREAVSQTTCAVVLQQPNFYGCLEDVAAATEIAHQAGALSILSFDAVSPGLLKKPADYGVDVAVAEGQPLGIPLQFGGPLLGIFTCRAEYVRKMPGRLVGTTLDRHGNPCFALNLQAREQHIRRDKATSNICTNQGLMALRAAVYLSVIGPNGLRQMAQLCHRKARYAASCFTEIPGVSLRFPHSFFREFTLRTPFSAQIVLEKLAEQGINAGPSISRFENHDLDDADQCFLVALTEKRSREDIDHLAAVLKSVLKTLANTSS